MEASNNHNSIESTLIASRHPCISCQQRKIKCDRKLPCSRCLTHGQECQQPAAQRPPRRSRRGPRDDAALERVKQLEKSLEDMRNLVVRNEGNDISGSVRAREAQFQGNRGHDEPNGEVSSGRLVIDEDKSRYISGSSWANLVDEVRDLKLLLHDDGNNNEALPDMSHQYLSDGIFLPHLALSEANLSRPTHLGFLWQTYIENVDPVMKILHVPSMTKVIESALEPDHDTRDNDRLIAAIKFAAVTSLTDDQCLRALNSPRKHLLQIFKHEVHTALNDSRFLTSHDLTSLQAFVIFLVSNRRHEIPRAMWISSGVALRMAQSIGLHRDGTFMRLPILSTELRRRLWWQLRMLDVSCAEDCGFLPTYVYGEDTYLPLNIHDTDINSEDDKWPVEREEFTEMTLSLIRFEICSRLHGFRTHDGKPSIGIFTGDQHIKTQSKSLDDCKIFLESRIFKFCSLASPLQRTALKIGQIMLWKLSLVVYYPYFRSSPEYSTVSVEVREFLASVSCDIIESSHDLIHDPDTATWSWLLQSYVHWHPVAYLLSELCRNPDQRLASRSWRAVDMATSDPHGLEPSDNKAIWLPLGNLLEKARAAARTVADKHMQPQLLSSEKFQDTPTLNAESALQYQLSGITDEITFNPPKDFLLPLDFHTHLMSMDSFMDNTADNQIEIDPNWWN